MELFKISKKELVKNIISEIILAIGICIYLYYLNRRIMVLDSLFLSGLLFICLGLFRIVMHLGLFNSTIFTFEKVLGVLHFQRDEDLSSKTYYEFMEEYEYNKSPWELIIPAIIALIPSAIRMFF